MKCAEQLKLSEDFPMSKELFSEWLSLAEGCNERSISHIAHEEMNAINTIFQKVERELYKLDRLPSDPYKKPKFGYWQKIGINNGMMVTCLKRSIERWLAIKGVLARSYEIRHVETSDTRIVLELVYRDKITIRINYQTPFLDHPRWIAGYMGKGVWRFIKMDRESFLPLLVHLTEVPVHR